MDVADRKNIETIKYRVLLTVKTLHLAKNANFNCKVLWKRHQTKTETKVVQHRDNKSVFNEQLQLEFNIQRDTRSGVYFEKNVDLLPIIIVESGLKSGGVARFDLAEPLNLHLEVMEKTVSLAKCPVPSGSLDILVQYERIGVVLDAEERSDSIIMQPGLEASRIEVKDNKEPALLQTAKKEGTPPAEEINLTKVIESLQRRLAESREREQRLAAELQKQKQEAVLLQKALDKKSQDLLEKCKEVASLKAQVDVCSQSTKLLNEKEEIIHQLETKATEYERHIQELQAKLSSTPEFPDHIFQAGGELDSDELKRVGTDKHFSAVAELQQHGRLEQLELQKLDLQTQLAVSNNRLANIFNVAYETGGAKLLDLLQSCIEPS